MPCTIDEYLALPIAWKRTKSETYLYQTRLSFSAKESEILSLRPVIMMSGMYRLYANGEKIGTVSKIPAIWSADDGWLWLTSRIMLDINDHVRVYLEISLNWKVLKPIQTIYCKATGPNGEKLQLYLGSFPDEPLFTLMKNGWALGDFDDWPENWTKVD